MMRGAGVLALVFAALSACATSPTPEEKTPAPVTEEMGAVPPSLDTFEGYLADLKLRARARGIDDAIIRETLQPVEERVNIASVIEDARRLDQNQAEFVKRVWTYLDTAASDTRVTTGRAKSAEFSAELASIQDDYGVDAPWLVAIWGLESNYGSFIGNHDVPTALAALAFDGRRRALFEGELFAVFDILRSGAARRGDLIGGWAGAMGQTQFMPSTYVTYARDFDGDGRKDVWGNTGDALASAAHLLSERGWTSGEPWGVEVALPDDFDYMLADGRDLTVAAWKAAGVAALPGKPIPDALLNRPAELLLPGGAAGPAFLTLPNFKVFKRYNNSTSYALAAGLLGDAIAGKPGLTGTWPRDERALTREEVESIQSALTKAGYNTRGVDGIVGPNTRRALREWQRDNGLKPDAFLSARLLPMLLAEG